MNIETLHLNEGESALFGYGSLISIESLQDTLGRLYEGPFVMGELKGWQRGWDVAMPNQRRFYTEDLTGRMYPENILYLNVWSKPDNNVNGVVFVVNAVDLAAFDQREWIYSREDITNQLRTPVVQGGRAYVYVGKNEYRLTNVLSPVKAAVRTSYLHILEKGLGDLGNEFRTMFENSSDPVPRHLVIADQR